MIVASVAMFVTAPLAGGIFRRGSTAANEFELERLEHERGLAVQGLRELEFDRQMGKLDDADYRELKAILEARALATMNALKLVRAASRLTIVRLAPRHPKSNQPVALARPPNFCPQCGAPAAGYNFCAECGAALNLDLRTAAQARVAS
jgi:hypothetical protein